MPQKNPGATRNSVVLWLSVLLNHRIELLEKEEYTLEANRHLRELISRLLWKHSEADGKYVGCRFWSLGAIQSHRHHGRVVTSLSEFPTDALRHEHLVPRHQLTSLLIELESPTEERVKSLLEDLNVGVVVTVSEHDLLAESGNEADPWQRYRDAGVEWEDTRR
ncbi:MAG: hypothetical protein GY930_07470 [bacterium]|nr:hypothetical protein [bacterium]